MIISDKRSNDTQNTILHHGGDPGHSLNQGMVVSINLTQPNLNYHNESKRNEENDMPWW